MVSGLKEELLLNRNDQVKVRCCRGATVEDMFDYFEPILRILTGKKHRQKKTSALTKSTNMDIWVVGNSTQLFIRGS